MLLIIGRRAGVFVRNTLRPSVLGLTECHSCQEPISGTLMEESRFLVPDTFVASAPKMKRPWWPGSAGERGLTGPAGGDPACPVSPIDDSLTRGHSGSQASFSRIVHGRFNSPIKAR